MLLTNDQRPEPTPADAEQDPRPSGSMMLRGEGRVTMARRGAIAAMSRLSGVVEPIHVEWLLDELDHQLAAGVTTLFLDASRVTLVSPAAIERLGRGLAQTSRALAAIHVLADSAVGPQLEGWSRSLRLSHDAEPFLAALGDLDG